MLSIYEYITLINDELKNRFNENTATAPRNLYKPIEYILDSGGKRIRALLVLVAANLFRDDLEKIIAPALGIEVFHNFTLLHDDIMDNADLRRGRATVHKRWDNNTAILSGDAMMILSLKLVAECEEPYMKQVMYEFNKAALEVCEGQQLDMDLENAYFDDDEVNVENYLKMIQLKTSVLLAASMKVGAILGGANEKDSELLYDFGLNVGIAFQLQDDYLDTFGNQETFGKKIGGDIIEGKKTFLTTKTKELADGLIWNDFLNTISSNYIVENERIKGVVELYENIGAKKETELQIEHYFEVAKDILAQLSVPDDKKKNLLELVEMLNKRDC